MENIIPVLVKANKKYEAIKRNVFFYWFEIRNENKWFLKIIGNLLINTRNHPQIVLWKMRNYNPVFIVSNSAKKGFFKIFKFFGKKKKKIFLENFEVLKFCEGCEGVKESVLPGFSKFDKKETNLNDFESSINFSSDNEKIEEKDDFLKIEENFENSKNFLKKKNIVDKLNNYESVRRNSRESGIFQKIPNYHNFRSTKILTFNNNFQKKNILVNYKKKNLEKKKIFFLISKKIEKIKFFYFLKLILFKNGKNGNEKNIGKKNYNKNVRMLMNENIQCKKELRKKSSKIDNMKNEILVKNKNLDFLKMKLIKNYFINFEKILRKKKKYEFRFFFALIK